MIQQDLRDLIGLRGDGRKPSELRNIYCKTGISPSADGSSHFKIGITEIICLIHGPKEINTTDKKTEKQHLLNVEYTVTPFSGSERRKVSKFDKDWNDFAENLRISFESLICREVYPKCEINILVSVIQADGSNLIDEFILILCCIGTKSAIFNAICLALLDAGIAMKDFMVSCTSAFVNNEPVIDLTHQEELNCNAELIISYTPKKDKISFMELKSSKVSQQDFLKIMEANTEACKIVYKKMREEIIKASLQRYICSK